MTVVLRERWDILLVVAVGGALGSGARWGVGEALPHPADRIAWSTMLVNVSGALALGVLMVLVLEVWPTTRYVRPFLGVGVLGGYTTFSTYMLDTRALLAEGRQVPAFGYLFGTLLAGLLAVWAGVVLARAAVAVEQRRRRRRRRSRSPAEAASRSDPDGDLDRDPDRDPGGNPGGNPGRDLDVRSKR